MRKLLPIFLILFFIVPLFGEESKLKLSFDDEPKTTFKVLQFTSLFLMNADTACTYNSYWNYSRGELNPILRRLLPYPELVFIYRLVVNTVVVLVTNKLYKKNKVLAHVFVITLNLVAGYFIYDHIRYWQN